jgi:hypothetical protein
MWRARPIMRFSKSYSRPIGLQRWRTTVKSAWPSGRIYGRTTRLRRRPWHCWMSWDLLCGALHGYPAATTRPTTCPMNCTRVQPGIGLRTCERARETMTKQYHRRITGKRPIGVLSEPGVKMQIEDKSGRLDLNQRPIPKKPNKTRMFRGRVVQNPVQWTAGLRVFRAGRRLVRCSGRMLSGRQSRPMRLPAAAVPSRDRKGASCDHFAKTRNGLPDTFSGP